jgi:glycosyltransferase involved in cell wall biosynthesis
MSNADLRTTMAEQGLARAAEFRWEKTARETVEVYRKVMMKLGN